MNLKLSRLPSGEPEIFSTVQGEGLSLGVPSVFCRFSLCNLDCSWCDTNYTWDWNKYDPKRQIASVDVADINDKITSFDVTNVVLTGGEPLQQQDPMLGLVELLKEAGKRIEVETNGTYQPSFRLAELIDQWNVSPKLQNSGVEKQRRHRPEALKWFASSDRAYFKFVISHQDDVHEVHEIVDTYRIPASRVLLMPEGTNSSQLAERSGWLAQVCLNSGYRFTTRLHILLWGDERGR